MSDAAVIVAPAPPQKRLSRKVPFPLVSAAVLAALVLALFAPLLMGDGPVVWSKPGLDLSTQVIPWWKFGFGEMAHGRLPLWNPHNFCGTPYFSNFNTGLLYPLHWLNLLMPLGRGVNLIGAACVWLAGWFTSLWCHRRGVSTVGAIIGGVVFMFSGAFFYHLYPGHESLIASMAWTPLVLLAVDELFKERAIQWMLIGALAVGMQILASFAQAVYLTGLVSGIYLLLRLSERRDRWRLLLLFTAMFAGGAAIGAVQLLPGLATAHESVRTGGNSIDFASQYSLPPENLLTLIASGVFGDMERSPYFGRSFLWEASLFCGVSTLVLAGCGIAYGDRRKRLFATLLLAVCLVLAMGAYVRPLYVLMYHTLPLFTSFRVAARFKWFATLYVALLAGIGFDALAERDRWLRPMRISLQIAVGVSIVAALIAFSARSGSAGGWGNYVASCSLGPDQKNDISFFDDPTLARRSGLFAANQLTFAGGTFLLAATALWLSGRSPRYRYALAAMVLVEMFWFARSILVTGRMDMTNPPEWAKLIRSLPADERVLHPDLAYSNLAMSEGYQDLYGYDPLALKRYSDLLSLTQGWDPDRVYFIPQPTWLRYPAIFRLLRCRFVFTSVDERCQAGPARPAHVVELKAPMARVQLVPKAVVAASREEIFRGLSRPDFDPTQTVYLEQSPAGLYPGSPGSAGAAANVMASGNDWLEVEATTPAPAVLLVTDAYSKGWRVRSLQSGGQSVYQLLPADYALMAVPLLAGHHHFRLEYKPMPFFVGEWITIIAAVSWCAASVWINLKRLPRNESP